MSAGSLLDPAPSLIDAAYALIGGTVRSLGGIVPDTVVEEIHTDGLAATEHPVERGAAVTDNAYRRPALLEMRCGFSPSIDGDLSRPQTAYDFFQQWQASREPRSVSTGRRQYANMLPTGMTVHTDARTANVLMIVVQLREIIISSTRTTGAGGVGGSSAAGGTGGSGQSAATGADMADPARTGPTINRGEVQPILVTDTAFGDGFSAGAFGGGASFNSIPGGGTLVPGGSAGAIEAMGTGSVGAGASGSAGGGIAVPEPGFPVFGGT